MQVLQWMEDAGMRPSNLMYQNILSFAQKSAGTEYAAVIQERIGMVIMDFHGNFSLFPLDYEILVLHEL